MKVTVVVVAIVCLLAGYFAGYKSAEGAVRAGMESDMNEVRFARSIGALSTAVTTLGLIEQRRGDAIQQVQERTLAQYAKDLRETVGSARHVGDRAASVDQTLATGMAYANRHGMKETVADLAATRQTLKAIAGR